jgi:hypothetical protein
MNNVLTSLVVIVSFLVGSVFLQIYLSKKENKLLGLILPCITFAVSIANILGVTLCPLFSAQVVQSGGVIVQSVEAVKALGGDMLSVVLYMFMLYNMPTGILILLYKSYRIIENTTKPDVINSHERAKQIRKSVYSILRQEQRERGQQKTQDVEL